MIDHVEIKTLQAEAAVRFYADVLGPLGYTLKMEGEVNGFGAADALDFFISSGEESRNIHFAFAAASRHDVDAAWQAGADNGHATDRAPALAPHIHPNYYAGYLRDPDGHLVELVCQRPE